MDEKNSQLQVKLLNLSLGFLLYKMESIISSLQGYCVPVLFIVVYV